MREREERQKTLAELERVRSELRARKSQLLAMTNEGVSSADLKTTEGLIAEYGQQIAVLERKLNTTR